MCTHFGMRTHNFVIIFLFVATCDSEWAVNHHRDSMASHIGHHDLMSYFSVAENESIGRIKFKLMEVWTEKHLAFFAFVFSSLCHTLIIRCFSTVVVIVLHWRTA